MEQGNSSSVVVFMDDSTGEKEGMLVHNQTGLPVHSQVRKIKQELEEKVIDWSPTQPELRRVLRQIRRQRSRSPLGLAGRPISVGDS